MNKYKTLVKILDEIRFEAPLEYKSYRPEDNDLEKINQARSRAFIHLFLKGNFNLLDFKERENFVTDGADDGGIDAYYIDKINKKVYIIQSKFRTNDNNFEEREITFEELLKMDITEILEGNEFDAQDTAYCSKIKQLQRDVNQTEGIARYKNIVVILANIKNITPAQLKKLTGGFDVSIFNYEQVYKKLLFPIVSGTYYNKDEIHISINLLGKSSNENVTYNVKTEYGECDITVLFVPVSEVARIVYQFKNSILKYNPRSYLEMQNNTINHNIYNSIVGKTTNDFALLNNGITLLSSETNINNKVGKKDEAQLIVMNPQIINGGQTSYTLSRIYEEILNNKESEDVFKNKEVLLKIITLSDLSEEIDSEQHKLIESISKSTNNQSLVKEADRRSNDGVQLVLQEEIYNTYGLYYERKKGEFADGVKNNYLHRSEIIDRVEFIRFALASKFPVMVNNQNPKNISENKMFEEKFFVSVLGDGSNYKHIMYVYFAYQDLKIIKQGEAQDKKDRFATSKYGRALRYGDIAVVMICKYKFYEDNFNIENIKSQVLNVLKEWLKFEEYAFSLKTNSEYFNEAIGEANYYGYYKGSTIMKDLYKYFIKND